MKSLLQQMKLARLYDPLVLYLFALLSVPQAVFHATSIYTFKTPGYIDYEILDEPVSVLYFPIFLFLFQKIIFMDKRKFLFEGSTKFTLLSFAFLLIVLLAQVLRSIFAEAFVFEYRQYELFFVSFSAICFASVLFYRIPSAEGLSAFFKLMVLVHAVGVAMAALLHVKDVSGRVNAQNLNYDMTAFIFALYCVFFTTRKPRLLFLNVILLGLIVLTGSRTHLFLTVAFLGWQMLRSVSIRSFLRGRQALAGLKSLLLMAVLTAVVVVLVVSGKAAKIGAESVQRASSIQSVDDIKDDQSSVGRLKSLLAGAKVLAANPFGLSFSFIDLQRNMNANGYPTFPHQNLLAIYLVLGPLLLIIIYYLLRVLFRLKKINHNYKDVYYYVLGYSLVAGGCPQQVKVLFIYLFILWMGAKVVEEHRDAINGAPVDRATGAAGDVHD